MGLVADIGRASVRFGLTGGDAGTGPRDIRHFHTADHATFTGALVTYLREVEAEGEILPSALAIAGAVRGDTVNITGSRWFVSLAGVEAVLRVRPHALNECAATALALPTLSPDCFAALPGPPLRPLRPGGAFLVVAPGTGLGVSALVTVGDRLVPVQSEAAHMRFAPATPDETRLVADLAKRGDAISNEAVLSARGLLAAYALFSGAGRMPRPEDVTGSIARDPAAAAAVALVVGALGAVVGDLVLAYGAWDGVILAGPIARALRRPLAAPAFRARMEAKPAFRRELSQVPVAIVETDDLELVGAAAALAA